MNNRGAKLSPVSVGGSEWSGISGYHSRNPADSPYGAASPYNRAATATPPVSTGSLGVMNGPTPNGIPRGPNGSPGNPSPPSSIARSSTGTGLYASSDSGSRKGSILEDALAEHYIALKRFLAASLRDEKGNARPNRARDKLLRLSAVQFQELSTDVFDELLRRQSSAGQRRNGPGGLDETPLYLAPRTTFHPKRNQARQKLASLPPPRFRDLATDVFYELERRFPRFIDSDIDRQGSPASGFRSGFGPNGASMGGHGSRPSSRGGPMGRGPGGPSNRNGPPTHSNLGPSGSGNAYGRPLPKSFQSNTIIPNKSTMVEDDDDQTDEQFDRYGGGSSHRDTGRSIGSIERDKKLIAEFQAEADNLQVKVTHLEGQMQEKESELTKLRESERTIVSERREWFDLRTKLEKKIEEAQQLHSSMQEALKRAQDDNIQFEKDYARQLDDARRKPKDDGGEWRSKYTDLDRVHRSVQAELQQQQSVTDEVQRQASDFLQEMRSLSDQSHESAEREERLALRMSYLENEIETWKDRYMRAKIKNAPPAVSTDDLAVRTPDARSSTIPFVSPTGLVKDIHVTKFQIAIDELLHVSRTCTPSSVLDQMKPVVLSVRCITSDLPDSACGDATTKKLTMRVAATANNLITAAKNFSSSNGLSPISLLDAAASHLSAAIIELIRLVQIRPTPASEISSTDDESTTPSPPAASTNFQSARNGPHVVESVYSTLSSPSSNPAYSTHASRSLTGEMANMILPATRHKDPSPHRVGVPARKPHPSSSKAAPMTNGTTTTRQAIIDEDLEPLKIFLGAQTESLVSSIQSLVTSIRNEAGIVEVRGHIDAISFVVGKVVSSTEGTMSQEDLKRMGLNAQSGQAGGGEGMLDRLGDCRRRLVELGERGDMKSLPGVAFEIARETKELVQRIDSLGSGTRRAKEEEETFR